MRNRAAILRCPGCGAPAEPSAARCQYCRARLATVSCPACFGAIFDGAAFCAHCGCGRSRRPSTSDEQIPCPACRGRMTWVHVGQTDLLECGSCDGAWMEAATFERLCTDREAQGAVLHTWKEPAGAPPARPQPLRYRKCPRCGRMMNRINFGRTSGAVVDVCKGDGTFLDRGELHQIVRFIQSGGVERARASERERLVEERRRLEDRHRDEARMSMRLEGSRWNDRSLGQLLASLFDR